MRTSGNQESTSLDLRAKNRKSRQRGVAISELAIGLPLLLVLGLATVDFGRYVYSSQVVNDLAREAGMLVSRGASFDEAFTATFNGDGPLEVQDHGMIVISRIRRHSTSDGVPWIFDQETSGSLGGVTSRIGGANGPAALPEIDELEQGVTLMAVEISHAYVPLFPIAAFGLTFYPETIYNAAIF